MSASVERPGTLAVLVHGGGRIFIAAWILLFLIFINLFGTYDFDSQNTVFGQVRFKFDTWSFVVFCFSIW